MTAPAVVSLKTDTGLLIGEARHVDHDGLVIDLDEPLSAGAEHEFRMELPGADDTVRGVLRVVAAGGGQVRACIVEVADDDRACFEAWWQEQRHGHVVYHPRLAVGGGTLEPGMHGATAAETHVALAQMDARRARVQARFQREDWRDEDTGEVFVPADLEPPRAPAPVARQAAREPYPPRAPLPRPPAPLPRPTAPPREHPAGPVLRLLGTGDEATLSVTWPTRDHLVASLTQGLASGFLALPHRLRGADLAHWPRHLVVHLHTPAGTELVAEGQHITDQPDHALYRLDLDPAELHALQAEALGA